jgi:hypothetical protein
MIHGIAIIYLFLLSSCNSENNNKQMRETSINNLISQLFLRRLAIAHAKLLHEHFFLQLPLSTGGDGSQLRWFHFECVNAQVKSFASRG